jgi:hypothetical protein
MEEYELSYDNVFFFDAQVIGASGEESIVAIVWLYNFQWSSWVKGRDDIGVMAEQWGKADAIVSFDEDELIMALMKSEFGLKYDVYINLLDYSDDNLVETAKKIAIEYPAELNDFDQELSLKLWADFKKGRDDALNSLLFYRAWYTDLIYDVFFHVCEEAVPVKVFIPWKLSKTKVLLKPEKDDEDVQDDELFKTLRRAYDFSEPHAPKDD